MPIPHKCRYPACPRIQRDGQDYCREHIDPRTWKHCPDCGEVVGVYSTWCPQCAPKHTNHSSHAVTERRPIDDPETVATLQADAMAESPFALCRDYRRDLAQILVNQQILTERTSRRLYPTEWQTIDAEKLAQSCG